MQKWIVPILFLVAPFAFLTPGLIWKSQLLFFLIMPVFILAVHIKNVWVKVFILYAMAWQFAVFLLTFNNNSQNVVGASLSVIMAIMAGSFVYKFISESELPTEKWFMVLRIAVILQILLAIPNIWGHSTVATMLSWFTPVMEKLPGHVVGTLGNRNYLAAFIAVSLPAFIGWRTFKIRGISVNPAIIVIFIFLGFCLSPGTLAAIIGMGFYLSRNMSFWKRMVAISVSMKVAVAFAAAYILTTGYHVNEFQALPAQLKEFFSTGRITVDYFENDVGRFAMWMMAVSKIIHHWVTLIFGSGPGAFWGRNYPIHGEYISILFQYGLIGLAIVGGYIVHTWRFLIGRKELTLLATSFFILLLDCVGNFPLQIATTSFMILIILGLIERERLKDG